MIDETKEEKCVGIDSCRSCSYCAKLELADKSPERYCCLMPYVQYEANEVSEVTASGLCEEYCKKSRKMKYINGDILAPASFESAPTMICHLVNCKGVMGAGLTHQVKEKYPWIIKAYKERCEAGFAELGQVQVCSAIAEAGYLIANIFGQDAFCGQCCHTDYGALRKAFSYLVGAYPGYVIRIPHKMGCGLGSGDWNVVRDVIEEELCAKGMTVEVWRKD